MSDSNTTTPSTTTQPPKQKSFTERFFELENFANEATDMMLKILRASGALEQRLAETRSELDGAMDSIGAVISLLEKGKSVTRETVIDQILLERSEALKANVLAFLADKMIVEAESVTSDETMIAYKIDGKARYAYNKVGNLEEALRSQLIGKAKGDKVEDLEILGIYEANKQEAPKQQD